MIVSADLKRFNLYDGLTKLSIIGVTIAVTDIAAAMGPQG